MDYFFSTCDLLFYPQIVAVSLTFFLLIHTGKSLVALSPCGMLWNLCSQEEAASPALCLCMYKWASHFGVRRQDSEKFWESRRFSQDMHVVTTSFCCCFEVYEVP